MESGRHGKDEGRGRQSRVKPTVDASWRSRLGGIGEVGRCLWVGVRVWLLARGGLPMKVTSRLPYTLVVARRNVAASTAEAVGSSAEPGVSFGRSNTNALNVPPNTWSTVGRPSMPMAIL